MIAIIIPFHQKSPGLLRRAVQSVLAQKNAPSWRVTVVDDGSPVDPLIELAPFKGALEGRLTVLRQPNRGVSAARNRGLDSLDESTEIVAFLDSDDVWDQNHLARAEAAMGAGADFYFDNYRRYDWQRPRFASAQLSPANLFDAQHKLHWFEGDFFDLLLKGCPAATPAIAYRFARMPHLRFRTDLWYCEDVYFWMEASRAIRRVAFSPLLGVFCGKGVNISEGSWGSLQLVRKNLGQTRYQHLVQDGFRLTSEQKRWNGRTMRGLDRDFWQSALAAASRGEKACMGMVLSYLAMRPAASLRIAPALAQIAQTKIAQFKRSTPPALR